MVWRPQTPRSGVKAVFQAPRKRTGRESGRETQTGTQSRRSLSSRNTTSVSLLVRRTTKSDSRRGMVTPWSRTTAEGRPGVHGVVVYLHYNCYDRDITMILLSYYKHSTILSRTVNPHCRRETQGGSFLVVLNHPSCDSTLPLPRTQTTGHPGE